MFVTMLLGSAAIAGCNREASNQAATNEARTADATPGQILEGYPTAIANSLDQHRRRLAEATDRVARGNRSLSSVIRVRQYRWAAGSVVRVAFRGGDPAAYARIEQAAQQWTQPGLAHITLSFRDEAGRFRQWTPQDREFAGEIRIGFLNDDANGGYWSLVGLDSIDPTILGGAAGQQSMNFEGFDGTLPTNWQGTVIHEFGHALGFEHEHQSPAAACGFRFDDDPGYVHTRDRFGQFINDSRGRRPGLYTLLGGPPNEWERAQVDYNLKQLQASSAYEVGPYDRLSIMEYFFEASMFARGAQSPCYIDRESNTLSAQDRIAAARAYPASPARAEQIEVRTDADSRALARTAVADRALTASLEARADFRERTSD
jgi:hypothetical protein